jgi:hypothetical protein
MSKKIYYHKHHIIPKHAGGTDDPSNIIELTVEEHAEAHRKLFEEYGRWQDEVAYKGISGRISCEEAIRLAQRNGKLGKGDMRTPEGKESWYAKVVGKKFKPCSDERKRKISEANKGCGERRTPEGIAAQRKMMRERTPHNKGKGFIHNNVKYESFKDIENKIGFSSCKVYRMIKDGEVIKL